MIFKKNQSKRFHITSIIIGVLFVTVGTIIYSLLYKNKVEELLKRSFRPEFLNRLDEIVFYKPLRKTEISKILDLLITDLERRLEDKNIKLELTQSAKDYLIDNGYDEVYGARPLKRFVQKKLETLIAKKILSQEILPNTTVKVDSNQEGLFISHE